MALLENTFVGVAVGSPFSARMSIERDKMAVWVTGFGLGQVDLEWSFDAGATWHTIDSFTSNDARVYDTPSEDIVYRFNCVAFVSGDIKTWLA